jgi:hypothetical protein
LYAFETLISNHVDKAFDKFTAWALRNTFDVPDDIEVVMVSLVEIRLISPGARIWILSAGRTSRRCRGARTPWSSR